MKETPPPYRAAALTAGAVFGLYALTLAPTTAFWDTSEYIATAHILGIPHPPGNPLFVVLARVWSLLLAPTGLSVAVRVNLFAAFTSAVATFFFFLVAHRAISGFAARRGVAVAGAVASAVLGATAFTVWNQSTVNEKVYTVSLAAIALACWLTVRWRDRKDEPGAERWLLGAGYVLVLGSTNHLMSVLPAPALLLFVLLAGAPVLARPRFWARAVPLALLGLSFNFFLPLRAAQDPVINEAEPTCEGLAAAAAAVYTQGRFGCDALASALAREQYAKPPVTERQAPMGAQLLNWFQYFDWQWSRGAAASETPGNARVPFTLLFLGLGLVGLWGTLRGDPHLFALLGTLAVVVTLGLVLYLNFEYGYSLYPDVADRGVHEVRERDYFFLVGFMLWGVLAGIGLAWVWSVLARQTRAASPHLLTSPVMAVALIPLVLNWGWASRAGDWAARDWAWDVLMSVEPYAVLFTNGDNDTFPLWYLQEVEGVRRDVTVIVGQYLFTDWYPKQLQRLTRPGRQRAFEGEVAEGLYGDANAVPERPVTELGVAALDGVTGGTFPEDLTLTFPQLAVTFPAGMTLDRSAQLALLIIHDSIDERPIYFASTSGLMGDLGLAPWAVRQGLVSKLELRPLDRDHPEGLVRGSPGFGQEWFDYERTRTLYEDVYLFRGLRDRRVWADRSTLNIPWHYYALSLQLADVGSRAGMDEDTLMELRDAAEAFLVTAQGGWAGTPGAPAAGEGEGP